MEVVPVHNNSSLNDNALVNYRLGFVIAWALGHITHAQNLEHYLHSDSSVTPIWMRVPPQADDVWQKLPTYAFRVSLRTRNIVLAALQNESIDCLFYHTQVMALFGLGLMQRIPTVISLDATPVNFKTIELTYGHKALGGVLDQLKFEWYRKMFHGAVALVGWSDWVKESLVQDYGVAPGKVMVIPPGIDLSQWNPTIKEDKRGGSLRLLFVGGEFARKGGYVLLEAFRCGLADRCTLDIVTKDENVRSEGPVRVHRGLTPNSSHLRQLFADADLFIFPTLGDALPLVVMEAMASGLPVVATNVGAIGEEVEHGVTGLLVPPNDPGAIVKAVSVLADDPMRLAAMGAAGRARAEQLFNGEDNYKALVDLLKRCVDEWRSC